MDGACRQARRVFSTSVEVFPHHARVVDATFGLLHVRGGVSVIDKTIELLKESSPRPWRCFWSTSSGSYSSLVFSTSVEVFPRARLRPRFAASLLHVRGGVSIAGFHFASGVESSPRPWRCFQAWRRRSAGVLVFSTSVEVFPLRMYFSTGFSMSSPRPWRCFLLGHSLKRTGTVFSTSVEVFPSQVTRALEMRSLLHVRGGVSYEVAKVTGAASSSPRPWRCFSVSVHPRQGLGVFSTSVEVFPTHSMPFLTPHGLLHVRGGVSLQPMHFPQATVVFSTSVEVFPETAANLQRYLVFSTSVEVFLFWCQ